MDRMTAEVLYKASIEALRDLESVQKQSEGLTESEIKEIQEAITPVMSALHHGILSIVVKQYPDIK
jgi:hypothetical protein